MILPDLYLHVGMENQIYVVVAEAEVLFIDLNSKVQNIDGDAEERANVVKTVNWTGISS